MKRNIGWLVVIILIAFVLRLLLLGKQSLWYDEGVSWMLSQMPLAELIQWTAADIQPPLYYLIIWATDIIFGDSEWALRFPSTVFNILTIPVIYVLARRLFQAPSRPRLLASSPLLAAAILAITPIMVYYSQEARMYTLLALEATLAGYLLLRVQSSGFRVRSSEFGVQESGKKPRYSLLPTPYSLLYAVTAAAALYTHYFATFLLVAHGIYALVILWQQRFTKWLLIQFLWAFGGAVLLFAPWLSILLARLGDDPSYWPGALKLNEVVRKVIISFTLGETVFEQTGWLIAMGYLAVLAICFVWVVIRVQSSEFKVQGSQFAIRYSLLFLLLWLFVPITLILLLSYQSPKFNPRYTLIAWPAFALIVAYTLASLYSVSKTPQRTTHIISYVLRFTFYAILLLTTTLSLTNWFTDPRFSKDDFKALAQFVKERKADDETVLLSSGHLFPVWAYYYGWEGWTPLPWMLRLNVNQITNLGISEQIAEAVEGQAGVWLVSWQDEVIDPNGVVPFWLDRIGERPNDAGDFWGVGLEHWQLSRSRVNSLRENPIKHDLNLNFNNQLKLVGMTQLSDDELVLFWQPLAPLPDDLAFTLKLTDRDSFYWGKKTISEPLGSSSYPPSRWQPGETVITRHQLPWQTGTPPGLYVAEIGLGTAEVQYDQYTGWDILDEQGRPQRRTALVDFVNLSQLIEPENGPLPPDPKPLADLSPIITLRRSILPQTSAQPGDKLLLALLWQAGEFNLDDISLAFDLIDAEGQSFRVGTSITPSRTFNLPRWNPGDTVLGQYWLNIPPEAAPGPASLHVHIISVGAFDYDEVFPFDQLDILPTERNFTPPQHVDMPLEADFSGQASLIGADCPNNCTARPGESVTLTLHWQANTPFDTGYTVFTHALAPDETVIINADHAPPKPTTGWVPNEIITDPVTLNIPADLPPGQYPIEVGLYNAGDPAFTRLPLTNGESRVILPQPLHVE